MKTQTGITGKMDISEKRIDDANYRLLMIINIFMLVSILIHDGDHIRQAMQWGYTLPISLLVLNIVVYLPTLIAILLTWMRRFSGAVITSIAGMNVAISFAKVHLLGASSGLWGIWNDPYIELGVDAVSWVILAYIVAAGLLVSVAGAYITGRLSAQDQLQAGNSANV